MAVFKPSRRQLLGALGAGAAAVGGTGLWLGIDKLQNERFRKPVHRTGFSPNVFLGVLADGQVQIWLTRSEMGQGISTALPMLVAEELDADWQRITVRQAQAGTSEDFGQLFTAASSSIGSLWIELRRAGALAREMLVSAAAARWQVDASDCRTESGNVYHGDEQLTYGELVDEAATQWVPIRPTLKPNRAFKLIGTSPARLDLRGKVTGETRFGADMTLPDMVRAVLARPPVKGQTLLSFDDQQTRRISGVLDVFTSSAGVVVVADSSHAALQGRAALTVEWSDGTNAQQDDNFEQRIAAGTASADVPAFSRGEVLADAPPAELTATYQVPFLAHACMEPMNCTVSVSGDQCEVWVGTQAPNGARDTAARAAGIPVSNVLVNVLPLGGGFGRRAGQDFVAEAVEIGTRLQRPVQLLWSREDDLGHGYYREACAISVSASRDAETEGLSLSCHVATGHPLPIPDSPGMSPLMGLDNLAYQFKALDVLWAGVRAPLPGTIWRSVGYSYNVFAIESFMDELAVHLHMDPFHLRKQLLPEDAPLSRCLDAVADLSGWHNRGKRLLGLAGFDFASTSVAMVAEIDATADDWRVSQVWCAVDCGTVVHADAASAQIEGGIVFGLSAALYERVDVHQGQVTSSNFNRYSLARMSDAPQIVVRFLENDRYPGGLGEASTPAIAPAIANALFQLTGERHRTLPLKA